MKGTQGVSRSETLLIVAALQPVVNDPYAFLSSDEEDTPAELQLRGGSTLCCSQSIADLHCPTPVDTKSGAQQVQCRQPVGLAK